MNNIYRTFSIGYYLISIRKNIQAITLIIRDRLLTGAYFVIGIQLRYHVDRYIVLFNLNVSIVKRKMFHLVENNVYYDVIFIDLKLYGLYSLMKSVREFSKRKLNAVKYFFYRALYRNIIYYFKRLIRVSVSNEINNL